MKHTQSFSAVRVLKALLLVLFGLVLSLATTLAETVYSTRYFGLNGTAERTLFLSKAVFYFLFFAMFWMFFSFLDRKLAGKETGGFPSWSGKSIAGCALLLFACWLPWFLLFRPGVANWDTINGLKDLLTGTMPIEYDWHEGQPTISVLLNDHHPVFDTLVYGAFYGLGQLTGSPFLGFAAYTICQMAAGALAFSLMLGAMERLGMPRLLRRAGLVFLALTPWVSLYMINMIKDTIFSIVFAAYFTVYVLIAREGCSRKKAAALIALSVLLALSKKTGVYIALFANLFLLFGRDFRKRAPGILASALLPALVIFVLMGRLLFPLLNIYPGGRQEMLGIPMQHLETIRLEHPEWLSGEEKEVIDAVIDQERASQKYQYRMTDGSKDSYNFYAADAEVSAFLKLWISQGLAHPKEYLRVQLLICGGYFAPTVKADLYTQIPESPYVDFKSPEETKEIREGAGGAAFWLMDFPGLDLLARLVLYSFWLPLLVFLKALLKKDWKGLQAMMPILVSVGFLLICPYSFYRYVLPQVVTAPLLTGLAFVPSPSHPGAGRKVMDLA